MLFNITKSTMYGILCYVIAGFERLYWNKHIYRICSHHWNQLCHFCSAKNYVIVIQYIYMCLEIISLQCLLDYVFCTKVYCIYIQLNCCREKKRFAPGYFFIYNIMIYFTITVHLQTIKFSPPCELKGKSRGLFGEQEVLLWLISSCHNQIQGQRSQRVS